MLFDGAVAATVADAAQPDAAKAPTDQPNDSHANDSHDATAATPPSATADQRQEIVFVDGKLQDVQALIAGLPSGTEVVVLDSNKDGLQQIADYLKNRSDVDAIHLLSHGAEGTVELGNTWLNSQNIGQHAQQLNAIGAALAADGDILIYGCDTGEGKQGATLLSELARLTQADVAASDDATGAASKGGDWQLESRVGQVESKSLELASYKELFAAPADEDYDDETPNTVIESNNFVVDGIRYVLVGPNTYQTSIADGGIGGQAINNNLMFDFSDAEPDGRGGLSSVTISAADGSAFKLAGISFLAYDFGGSPNIQLTPQGGTPQSFTINGTVGTLVHLDLSGNADFQNITSFTFSGNNLAFEIDNLDFEAAVIPNAAPVIGNLAGDSVAWAGAGNTVTLDSGGNASLTDTDFGALNSGNGDWSGANLTVQRSGTAITTDTFGFNTSGALFTVSGNQLQSGGLTFATFTNSGGVLSVNYTSSGTTATTALVNDVARHINYRNDTPAGDATVRFTLSDGNSSTTAIVTVTSDTIYVTNTTDTATIDASNGVSFSEAVAIAAADATGSQTIVIAGSLAGQSVSTSAATSLGENLTLNLDAASGSTLSGGTLSIGSGFSLTASNGTGDTATIATALTGAGGLTKTGAGTLTLSGSNSYSGATTLSAGTLTASGGSAIGDSSSVSVASGATLSLSSSESTGNLSGVGTINLGSNTLTSNITADSTFSGDINGTGGLTVSQAGAATFALTLSGANTYTGNTIAMNFGSLRLNGDASVSSSSQLRANGNSVITLLSNQTVGSLFSNNANATINLGAFTLTAGGDNSSTTVSGVIAGTGSLIKQGSGTLTLSGTNTYGGTTTVSAGTLSVASDSNLGSDSVTLASGATLDITGATNIDNAIALSGDAIISNSANATLSGVISGAYTLSKTGASTLTLSNTNTYAGTTVLAGTLSAAGDNNLGSGAVTLESGSTLAVTGATTIDNAVVLSGAASISTSANVTVSGVVSGSGSLTKTGASTLTLSGTNTHTGNVIVSAGGLTLQGGSSIGDGSAVSVAGGATLTLALGNETIGSLLGAGNVSLSYGLTTGGNQASTTFSGVISSTNTSGITKTGSGTFTLSGANTYSGTTTVSAGTLTLNGGSALADTSALNVASGATVALASSETVGSLAGAGSLSLGAFTLSAGGNNTSTTFSGALIGSGGLTKTGNGTLTLSGSNSSTFSGAIGVSGGTLSVASDDNLGAGTVTLAAGSTLSVTGATTIDNAIVLSGGTATVTNSANATLSGNITGAGGLTKAGTSALTLSGTDSYTGATSIDAGSLLLNGALTGTSSTTVASGATLGGSGSIASNVTVNSGGTLAPGNSGAGSMTINGNLDMASGSTLAVDINGATAGTGYDQVIVNGSVDVSGATLAVTHGYTPGPGDTYTIIVNDLADAVTGNFSGLSEGATLTAGGNGTVLATSYIGATGNDVSLTAPLNPTVTSVTATDPNGTYAIGDTITIGVTFSEPVFLSTGTLQLILETGTTDRTISYVSGSGSSTLYFSYTVQAGDTSFDLDYASVSALVANGDTIQSGTFITANLALPTPGAAGSLGANNAIVIDGVRPTAGIVVADTALGVGETSTVTITFSEAVSGLTTTDFTVANGVLSDLSSGDGGITWTATLTPTTSFQDATNFIRLNNAGYIDAAGNTGSGSTDSNNYAVDTLRPNASIVVDDAALAIGETSTVTITFTEAVTGLSTANFIVANGVLSNLTTSDNITWTATFTPTAAVNDATNLITLDNTGYTDDAGNTGSGSTDSNNYAIDSLRPNASIVVADTALVAGETSLVTITFSEAVTGLTSADFTVANGALSGLSSSDGGITWTATLTPSSSVQDATNFIRLNNAGYTDLAGNAGVGSTDSNNYTVDTLRPSASIVVADTALAAGETSTVTIAFSEAVTGLTSADFTVANGSLSSLSSNDGGITWTATFIPTASVEDTSNVITLDNTGYTDNAGNTGSGSTDSNNYAIDSLRPNASIVVADTALAAGETSTVTITFSEAVTGLTSADFTVANGSLSGLSSNDGGITWTATFTPSANLNDASNVITLDNTGYIDLAGNAGVGNTDSNNYAIDSLRPNASIVVANTALAAGETSTVTITFSEAVTGLTSADFTVANGSLSGLSSSDGGITWTATFTPSANLDDASNVIILDNTGYTDLAGNAGVGSTNSNNYAIDTVQALVIDNGDPEFRANPPSPPAAPPSAPSLPAMPSPPPASTESPLIPPPLFEAPTLGSGIPTLGNIFIKNGALAPSFIAQVFASSSSDIGGDGSGAGFLGFGGGDGGVFGSSTLSSIFGSDPMQESEQLEVFDGKKWGSSEGTGRGGSGAFGAPTLGQQLHELHESEQRQVHEIALALGQFEIAKAHA
ncbi:DUF4347 domain-containing protein [Pseudomonas sp. UL070]|uniref:DUF4347 domain-containing protein n=2 Tax=Aquipseudomonas ullengensis TaxID=2759166 RepID=A0A7W4QBP6_9GAMM|nr:DUF4347 domain-containing protein [Pseudomonas ullengensis]